MTDVKVNEPDESVVVPSDRYADEEPAAMPPMDATGVIPLPVISRQPLPQWTAKATPCKRSCRFYVEIESHFEAENPEGEFHQVNRYCKTLGSAYLDLTDDFIYECDQWDPTPQHECADRDLRRRDYERVHKSEEEE